MLLFLWTSLSQNILPTNNCLKCIYRFSLNIRKWLISTFTLEKYCQNVEKKEMRLFVWILNGKDTLWDEISFNKCALVLTVHVLISYPHIQLCLAVCRQRENEKMFCPLPKMLDTSRDINQKSTFSKPNLQNHCLALLICSFQRLWMYLSILRWFPRWGT